MASGLEESLHVGTRRRKQQPGLTYGLETELTRGENRFDVGSRRKKSKILTLVA